MGCATHILTIVLAKVVAKEINDAQQRINQLNPDEVAHISVLPY